MAVDGVLVDAGPLVAILSVRDQHHRACTEAARTIRGPFFTAWTVIAEAAHLLKGRGDCVERLLELVRVERLRLLQVDSHDVAGISKILTRYSDQGFDLADATLMHLADRESFDTVFTVDHRHFSIYRTSRGQSPAIVPDQLHK